MFLSILFAIFASNAQVPEAMPENLPTLSKVRLTVTNPGMTAAQPRGIVEFEYASCAGRSFDAQVESSNNVVYVKIIDLQPIDCMGSVKIRNYEVQVTSDVMRDQAVVILNPQSFFGPIVF